MSRKDGQSAMHTSHLSGQQGKICQNARSMTFMDMSALPRRRIRRRRSNLSQALQTATVSAARPSDGWALRSGFPTTLAISCATCQLHAISTFREDLGSYTRTIRRVSTISTDWPVPDSLKNSRVAPNLCQLPADNSCRAHSSLTLLAQSTARQVESSRPYISTKAAE